MRNTENKGHPRRVLVGLDMNGLSSILEDEILVPSAVRPNGAVLHDLWHQRMYPTHVENPSEDSGDPPVAVSESGIVVRLYTLPPELGTTESEPLVVSTPLGLHKSDFLFAITVLRGRVLVQLQVDYVDLTTGDSIVIPGCMHDLRNVSDAPAILVYTTFPLESHCETRPTGDVTTS